jgi:hypothetical protein
VDDGEGVASAGVDTDRLAAAAQYLRGEVLALSELGVRHAELGSQVELLSAQRDTLANEYKMRYRQLVGGNFVIDALRQLGMNHELGEPISGRKGKRSTVKKARVSGRRAAKAVDATTSSAG